MGRPPCVPMFKDSYFWYGVVLALLGLLLLRYLNVL
jgi:hypothetical protein